MGEIGCMLVSFTTGRASAITNAHLSLVIKNQIEEEKHTLCDTEELLLNELSKM